MLVSPNHRFLAANERTMLYFEEHEVLVAAREMIGPSVYGQAIIITVYLPILALTGVEGKMFRPMATTVIMALAAAFVLSMTLVPALVALLVRGRVQEGDNWLVRLAKRAYAPSLRVALRLRVPVVLAALGAFFGSALLFSRLGAEFAPNLDEGDVVVMATRPPATSIGVWTTPASTCSSGPVTSWPASAGRGVSQRATARSNAAPWSVVFRTRTSRTTAAKWRPVRSVSKSAWAWSR